MKAFSPGDSIFAIPLNKRLVMNKAEELFKQLATDIPELKEGKMFGAACLKTPGGKSAAMFWKDCIVVKLQGGDHAEAMALKGSKLFEPMDDRPMKEWVQITYANKDKWERFAKISADAVRKFKK
jgi:hypothetical protein